MKWLKALSWPSTLRLRTRLFLSLGLMLALLVAAGAWMIFANERASQSVSQLLTLDRRLIKLCDQSNTALIKARLAEKDFLLRARELGFDESTDKYVSLVRLEVASILENMTTLERLTADPILEEKAESIKKA